MSAQFSGAPGVGVDEARDAAEAELRSAFEWACRMDVVVRKPGNVSLASPGHGMQAQQFLDSARASAACLFVSGRSVGERLEAAVAATRSVAGCNTNLGILLLCAPLGCALQRTAPQQEAPCALPDTPTRGETPAADGVGRTVGGEQALAVQPNSAAGGSNRALRHALSQVLDALDLDDAAAAYRAIALANPGGLGQADAEDVHRPPSVGLRAAMALAAGRDLIAAQYANGFEQVFALGLPAARAPAATQEERVLRVYLAWLASHPDSHILRKHGAAAAAQVRDEAWHWRQRLEAAMEARAAGEGGAGRVAPEADPAAGAAAAFAADTSLADALATWDEDLKTRGLNPGTSADLTVCTLFLAAALDPGLMGGS